MEITALVLQLVEIRILSAYLNVLDMEVVPEDITQTFLVEVMVIIVPMALLAEETVVVLSEQVVAVTVQPEAEELEVIPEMVEQAAMIMSLVEIMVQAEAVPVAELLQALPMKIIGPEAEVVLVFKVKVQTV